MMTRPDLTTTILAEVSVMEASINSRVYTNGNNEITAAMVNETLQRIKLSSDTVWKELNTSKFNLMTDTTNQITEGTNPDKWFFSVAHFLQRFEDPMVVTTDNLNEGTTNLYWTELRTDTRINLLRPQQSAVPVPSGSSPITVPVTVSGFDSGGFPITLTGNVTVNVADSLLRASFSELITKLVAHKALS